MSVRRWIEADQVGLAVHFDEEPSPEEIAVFENLCRWLAADPERIRLVLPNADTIKITRAEADDPGDRQLERIESLRRRAGMDQ